MGLIPTGWYPTAVAVRPDGRQIYVVNGKSNTGPVPLTCRTNLETTKESQYACQAANQYVWQKEKAGFLAFAPPTPETLADLTARVAANNHVFPRTSAADAAKIAFLRAHIRHVIYIVKENRTYDQVLGDLEVGNGDPKLAVFGAAMTPNLHDLARRFVDLDTFFDSGESSNTGWNWTVAGRTNDWTEREAPVNYAGRGLQYDQEGANRGVNVGFATTEERLKANPVTPKDPDMLPGVRDVAAPDGPGGDNEHGYLWDQALKAGLSVRNWGFYGDLTLYFVPGPDRMPLEREPWKTGLAVFTPAKASLMTISDPYFRGFDQSFPDFWRFKEWEREFDGFVASGTAPNLMMVRLAHDHTGNFGKGNRRGGHGGDRTGRQRLCGRSAGGEDRAQPLRQGHPDFRRRRRRPGRSRPCGRAPFDRPHRGSLCEARRGDLSPLRHRRTWCGRSRRCWGSGPWGSTTPWRSR